MMPGVEEGMNGAANGGDNLDAILAKIYEACQHSKQITKFKTLHSLTFLDDITLHKVSAIP